MVRVNSGTLLYNFFCNYQQAQQTDNSEKYRLATVKVAVLPANFNDPVVTIVTGGTTGYIRENVNYGTNVRAAADQQASMRIRVTDADVVGVFSVNLFLFNLLSKIIF